MNAEIINKLAKDAVVDRPYPDARFPPALYYRFLKRLSAYKRPSVSIELGVCGGGASLHLALGWSEGLVVGVDHAEEYADNLKYVGQVCSNFQFIRSDSIVFAKTFYDWGSLVDILFIDTVHTFEQTMAEWTAWKELMNLGSILVLDDLFRPGMDLVWDSIEAAEKIQLNFLHDGSGFGVMLL